METFQKEAKKILACKRKNVGPIIHIACKLEKMYHL